MSPTACHAGSQVHRLLLVDSYGRECRAVAAHVFGTQHGGQQTTSDLLYGHRGNDTLVSILPQFVYLLYGSTVNSPQKNVLRMRGLRRRWYALHLACL